MVFKCPNGHEVRTTYDKWRKHHNCPICEKNPYKKIGDIQVKPKKSGVKRVLALDQATKVSGFAIFDDEELVVYNTFTTDDTLDAVERINIIKNWVYNMIVNWKVDCVILEDIQLQQFGNKNTNNIEGVTTYKTLSHLQGVLLDLLFESKIEYYTVYSSVWRSVCDIKGKTRTDKKRSAQLKVKEWYNVTVSNDEADAICIGRYLVKRQAQMNKMLSW